jgi:hypothetical protein
MQKMSGYPTCIRHHVFCKDCARVPIEKTECGFFQYSNIANPKKYGTKTVDVKLWRGLSFVSYLVDKPILVIWTQHQMQLPVCAQHKLVELETTNNLTALELLLGQKT